MSILLKDKGIGIYDRQMQSWNAGRRAALREKTKSFVYIEMNMGIEIEWWDVEGTYFHKGPAKVPRRARGSQTFVSIGKVHLSISRILWRFSK